MSRSTSLGTGRPIDVGDVLFVTNGHGEAAIAQRIALELRSMRFDAGLDHLALVGDQSSVVMRDVGPRRAMPSGGLIAMGNVRNFVADVRAGLLGLTLAQLNFLRGARKTYDVVVAVGDAFALAMAFRARRPTVFVGSAKSVDVAPYGRFEERLLRRASACFVRDEATAQALRRHGVEADVANAIVDLFASPDDTRSEPLISGFAPALALLPGSRANAYGDAVFLIAVVAALARRRPSVGAALSIAPGLRTDRFQSEVRSAGIELEPTSQPMLPFVVRSNGRAIVRAWRGPLGAVLRRVDLVLGQAGTANEAAAAAGVPVVAFERDSDRKGRWYRERQRGLLGDALAVLPGCLDEAVAGVDAILNDGERRRRMGEAGRRRMGAPGGARRIAERIAAMCERS